MLLQLRYQKNKALAGVLLSVGLLSVGFVEAKPQLTPEASLAPTVPAAARAAVIEARQAMQAKIGGACRS